MNDISILDKIKKIYNKANSARQIGSLEEANSMFAAMHKIMARHDIEIADVKSHDLDPGSRIFETNDGARYDYTYQRVLWGVIAECNNCKSVYVAYYKKMYLVGRKRDIEMVEYIYSIALRTFSDICKKSWKSRVEKEKNAALKRYGGKWTIKELIDCNWLPRRELFKKSFFLGAANGLRLRYERSKQELTKEYGDSYATQLIKTNQLVESFIEKKGYKSGRKSGGGDWDMLAFLKGESVGMGFSPSKPIKGDEQEVLRLG